MGFVISLQIHEQTTKPMHTQQQTYTQART